MDAPEIHYERDDYSDLRDKEPRFDVRAYDFVLSMRDEIARSDAESGREAPSGRELLDCFRDYALDAFGPLAYAVLRDWGVTCCEDVCTLFELLVTSKRMKPVENCGHENFVGAFDFKSEFRDSFEPLS